MWVLRSLLKGGGTQYKTFVHVEKARNDKLTFLLKIVQTLLITHSLLYPFAKPAPHKVPAPAQEEIRLSASIVWEALPPAEAAAASRQTPHRFVHMQTAIIYSVNNESASQFCFCNCRPERLHLRVLCPRLQELPQPGRASHDSHWREAPSVSNLCFLIVLTLACF